VKEKNLYDRLGEEREILQAKGDMPDWVTTPAYQMLKEKTLLEGETLKDRYDDISRTLSKYMPNPKTWQLKFYELLWYGHLAASTPVLGFTGRSKGCPVSCSGGIVSDSIKGFYEAQVEAALLTKEGFGTSGYLGLIRPRGSKINGIQGSASGVLPVLKDFVQLSNDVNQGSQRRGAWAGYIEVEHKDVPEIISFINKNPDSVNIGWNISDSFINRLDEGDQSAILLFQSLLKLKMVHGKGYFNFIDKVNRLKPACFKDKRIFASNLCNEIHLPSSEDETFTCVLSSLNLSKYDEWRDTTAIWDSLVFLYCVALNFIERGKDIQGLEKAVRFTRNNMALGLGVLGYATYLQDKDIPFESMEAYYFNSNFFKEMKDKTDSASRWLATVFGECEVTKGTGKATSTNIAIAPNLTSALICGSVSQGIEPVYKNAYNQLTAAGKIDRINPTFVRLLKRKKLFTREFIARVITHNGSIQNFPEFTEKEKLVFKTAFEIDQLNILRDASMRQREIDQGQSLTLFFSADEDEEYIAKVHKAAFKDEFIKGLYYIRSETGIPINKQECVACEG